MVENHSVIDKVNSFSMMVYNNYIFSVVIKFTAFDKVLVMGINDYESVIISAACAGGIKKSSPEACLTISMRWDARFFLVSTAT